MAKYKVIRGGFNSNGNSLTIGSIFEGQDKGMKFLEQPAITIQYLGQPVNVPTTYLQSVDDSTPLTDGSSLEKYNSKRKVIKSATGLVGLGSGLFIAHKMKKGVWGYVGFGLLGLIVGNIVGGQVSNIVLKKN